MIRSAAVIGTGIMARQITEFLASNGLRLILVGRTMQKANDCLLKFKDKSIASKIKTSCDIDEIEDVDLIIETISENAAQKQDLFSLLDSKFKNSIISSNTSSIPISILAKHCHNKSRIIGIHFSNPVHAMKLCEVIPIEKTSSDVVEKVIVFLESVGKIAIKVKDSPGFILNRILFTMLNEAAYLSYNNIANPEDIDKIMELGANHPIGPLKIMDLIGIDTVNDILLNLYETLKDDKFRPCPIFLEKIKAGELGKKTGSGFYSYAKK